MSSSYIVRLTATLRNEDGAWFQRRWNNAKICPPLVQVEINDLIGSGLPPSGPLASTYHIKETWVNALYRNPGRCWLQDDEKELSIMCTEKQYNGHYFNKLFSCWGGSVAKACMCQRCHTVVSDRRQLRQMQLAPVETEPLLKLEGKFWVLIRKHPARGFPTPGTPDFQPF